MKKLKGAAASRVARLFRVRLFYKVIVANGAIAFLLAALALVIDRHRAVAGHDTLALMGIGTLLMTALVNAFLVRLALRPVDGLQEAARAVTAGNYEVRIPPSPIGDAGLEQLATAFNVMTENLGRLRARQRELTGRFMASAEDDRERIARRLHEGIAQQLASLTLKVTRARNTRDESARDTLLGEVASDLATTTKDVVATVQTLRPGALELLGLSGAVEWYARLVEDETGVQVRVASGNLNHNLDAGRELALYRIIEEAINNAVRHSAGQRVAVQLGRENGAVVATVEDNGGGFDAQTGAAGLGLFAMAERAAYLGGSLELNSGAGGTRVRVNIPVRNATSHA